MAAGVSPLARRAPRHIRRRSSAARQGPTGRNSHRGRAATLPAPSPDVPSRLPGAQRVDRSLILPFRALLRNRRPSGAGLPAAWCGGLAAHRFAHELEGVPGDATGASPASGRHVPMRGSRVTGIRTCPAGSISNWSRTPMNSRIRKAGRTAARRGPVARPHGGSRRILPRRHAAAPRYLTAIAFVPGALAAAST
jgi:hypothetical protein